jgi:eukaryotic-like serine/threonine-protein kinase
VAIKTLPDRAEDDHSHERLRTEASAAAQLNHACIASVYDYGEASAGWRRRAPFIVMEHVDGQTLAARLSSGPLSWQDTVRICTDVATGLAAAHARGLVHRDVKPGNVILSGSGVKVLDFGIATACGRNQSHDGGVVFGTRAYMAPELLTDATADPANDRHAFGLVLRECLTDAPADRATEPAPADTDGPAAPRPPDVPAAVSALVGDCLAQTPSLRPTARPRRVI